MAKWQKGFLPSPRGEGSQKALVLLVALAPILAAAVQGPAEKKPTEPLKVAPREYFARHCQRCHGVDGSNFVPGFADEPEEKLRADIVRMADGPGGAPLEPEDVEVQIAYHRLFSDERPFASWTAREGLTLTGELSEGAKLAANVGEAKIDKDGGWSLALPSEADFARLRLTATLGKRAAELIPSESPIAKPPKAEPEKPPKG